MRDAVCARGAALAKAPRSAASSIPKLNADQMEKLSNIYRTQMFKMEQTKFQVKQEVKILKGEFAQRLSNLKGARSTEMQDQLNELMAWVRQSEADDDASESEESEPENDIDDTSEPEDDAKRKERHDEKVLPRAAQTAAVENEASTSGVDTDAPAKKQRLMEVPLEVNPSLG